MDDWDEALLCKPLNQTSKIFTSDSDSVRDVGPQSIAKCNKWYYHRDMELISVKLPPALRAKVAAEAQRRNVSQSTIVRESLERVLTGSASRGEASCADLAGSLVGTFRSGRRDLSTNKKLLADAMVSNARRGRKRHR